MNDTLISEFAQKNPDLKLTVSNTAEEGFKSLVKFHVKIGVWSEQEARDYISRITDEIFKEME